MKPENTWVFCAGGKHPVAKDYIMLGQETPAIKALFRWMEEGWSRVKNLQDQHSWRFFTKGLKTGEVACGLVRDSRDRAGRPFPFMVTGYGRIEKWEQQWELLPYTFDDLWERMEFLCIKRFFDLDDLKSEISRLPAPVSGETHHAEGQNKPCPVPSDRADAVIIPLNDAADQAAEVVQGLRAIRERYPAIPAAIFIGGTRDRVVLQGFMKSLNITDFERLWSIC